MTIGPAGSSPAPGTNSTRCSSWAGLFRRGATPAPRLAARGIAWGAAGTWTAGWIWVVISCLPEVGDAGLEAVGTGGAGPEEHAAGTSEVPTGTRGDQQSEEREHAGNAAERWQAGNRRHRLDRRGRGAGARGGGGGRAIARCPDRGGRCAGTRAGAGSSIARCRHGRGVSAEVD